MAPATAPTYSFKALNGAIVSPLIAAFLLNGGNIGAGKITINMATKRTEHDTSADGTVMPSYVSGASGDLIVDCQQTSLLHQFLLDWYNLHTSAAEGSDVSNWAATVVTLRDSVTGMSHIATGVSPSQIPPKNYGPSGERVQWTLMATNIQST